MTGVLSSFVLGRYRRKGRGRGTASVRGTFTGSEPGRERSPRASDLARGRRPLSSARVAADSGDL